VGENYHTVRPILEENMQDIYEVLGLFTCLRSPAIFSLSTKSKMITSGDHIFVQLSAPSLASTVELNKMYSWFTPDLSEYSLLSVPIHESQFTKAQMSLRDLLMGFMSYLLCLSDNFTGLMDISENVLTFQFILNVLHCIFKFGQCKYSHKGNNINTHRNTNVLASLYITYTIYTYRYSPLWHY
jgi:hypothetical protein